jgi:cytochrome c-type biogenesis protein CcmE
MTTTERAPGDPGSAAPASPRRARPRHRLRLAVVFAVLAAALVFLLAEGLGSSLNYFDTVDQAVAHKLSLGTTTFRLEGVVVPGTIERTSDGADFTIAEGGQRLAVQNSGSPPQLFQPDIPVVVVGHFASTGSDVFVSDQIMVKHSAQYIAAHPGRVTSPDGSVR